MQDSNNNVVEEHAEVFQKGGRTYCRAMAGDEEDITSSSYTWLDESESPLRTGKRCHATCEFHTVQQREGAKQATTINTLGCALRQVSMQLQPLQWCNMLLRRQRHCKGACPEGSSVMSALC